MYKIFDCIKGIFSQAGSASKPTEDAMVASHDETTFIVCDGATPAGKMRLPLITPPMTSARWAAERAADIALDMFPANTGKDNPLEDLNAVLRKEYCERTGIADRDITDDRREYPSSTLSGVTIDRKNGIIHFIQIGDSPVLVKKRDKSVIVYEGDPVLMANEDRLDAAFKRAANHPDWACLTGRDRSAIIQQEVDRDNTLRIDRETMPLPEGGMRQLMNRPDGYGVASITVEPPKLAVCKKMDLEDVAEIILMTDGLAEFMRYHPKLSWQKFAETVFLRGIVQMAKDTRLLETEDAHFQNYPRLKVGDDITALHLDLTVSERKTPLIFRF